MLVNIKERKEETVRDHLQKKKGSIWLQLIICLSVHQRRWGSSFQTLKCLRGGWYRSCWNRDGNGKLSKSWQSDRARCHL